MKTANRPFETDLRKRASPTCWPGSSSFRVEFPGISVATNGVMVTPPKWTTREIALHLFDFTKRSMALDCTGLVDLDRCHLYQLSVMLWFFCRFVWV